MHALRERHLPIPPLPDCAYSALIIIRLIPTLVLSKCISRSNVSSNVLHPPFSLRFPFWEKSVPDSEIHTKANDLLWIQAMYLKI